VDKYIVSEPSDDCDGLEIEDLGEAGVQIRTFGDFDETEIVILKEEIPKIIEILKGIA
jgi:hypothetical protein